MNFTKNDIHQIESKGLTVEQVKSQIEIFKTGVPYVNLSREATIDFGILKISDKDKVRHIKKFKNCQDHLSILKFVPASGAATRMFKFLFHFINEFKPEIETINAYINRTKANELSIFLMGLEKLPFFEEVIHKAHEKVSNFNELNYDQQRLEFVKIMLDKDQLNFAYYPKGLLPFHRYREHVSTAFEEHLFEGALYASSNKIAAIHFTISEKHKHRFDEEFKYIEEDVERRTNTKFNITFSYQKESTDTISVTRDNALFRDQNGHLVFRPSGHGALINNLDKLKADVIFIKNIDNVVVKKFKDIVADHKMMLAGVLLEVQELTFDYLNTLENELPTENTLIEIAEFLSQRLNVFISDEFEKYSRNYQIEYLKNKLNRPIRVCGMVKNEGEPGGGPFWVKNESGNISLQIVESAQIDKKNKHQKTILKKAAYFNPVDLVCGIKNYQGKFFDLHKFVDHKTSFISEKTKSGKSLKALELPGLWNGAMSHWNTLFVEVPLKTFNPVKTVNDLLKSAHQIV